MSGGIQLGMKEIWVEEYKNKLLSLLDYNQERTRAFSLINLFFLHLAVEAD